MICGKYMGLSFSLDDMPQDGQRALDYLDELRQKNAHEFTIRIGQECGVKIANELFKLFEFGTPEIVEVTPRYALTFDESVPEHPGHIRFHKKGVIQ